MEQKDEFVFREADVCATRRENSRVVVGGGLGLGSVLLPEMMCVSTQALEPTVTGPVAMSQGSLALPHCTGACAEGFLEGKGLWPQNVGTG